MEKREHVFSARVKLFTSNKKSYLEVQLFTDINYYDFAKMCHLIFDKNPTSEITSMTDEALSDEQKEKIAFCKEDFETTQIISGLKTVAQKYWRGALPVDSFQIYIKKDFEAVKDIVPFFNEVVKYKDNLKNPKAQRQESQER